jgi:hypothetical protein
MTCQKTKSKLGNRRVRLELRESFQKCCFRFRLRESQSFSNRSREKDQTTSLLCLLSTERDVTHVYRSYLRDDSRGIFDRSEVPWYLREPFQRIRIKTTIKETTSWS